MKNILISICLIGLNLTLLGCSPFKGDFNFKGTTYSHVKKMSGGEITNHFYTPNGEEMTSAREFIQILEVSDKIPKIEWPVRFKPLYNQYKLEPFNDEEFELTGRGQKSGFTFNSYATLITMKGKEYMAMYINTINADENDESDSEKIDIISELQVIRFE